MEAPDLNTRVQLAEKLRGLKQAVAEAVTDEFFQRHPDWRERYGTLGRQRGIEDACFHQDFLAGAIESGDPGAFRDYVRWTTGVLQARGIAPHFVRENVEQLLGALGPRLTTEQQALVKAFVREGLLPGDSPTEVDANDQMPSELALARRLFIQAILRGERKAAVGIALGALRAGQTIGDVYAEVLQKALYEVGRRWETNQITVAREHMATAVTQSVMAQLYQQLPPPTEARGTVVLTGVEGEFHQVGANMVADMLEADGWSVCFLGTNLPHAGILQTIEEHQADVVGISTTMLFNVPRVRQLITDIRQSFPANSPRVMVGGAAFKAVPTLWQEIGADGYAPDLRAALTLAQSFTQGQ